MIRLRIVMALLAVGMLAACTQSPAPQKPQPKPAEFITGRSAFQKLYVAARGWQHDAQPFRLESQTTADSKGQDGKSAVWRGSFASPLSRGVKPYVWSGTEAGDAPSGGVSPGTEDNYNPNNSSTHVFDMAFLKVDSDEALKTAQQHGGEKLLQKEADTPVFYVLEWSGPTSELVWHVYYGPTRNEAKLKVDVNASTGAFINATK